MAQKTVVEADANERNLRLRASCSRCHAVFTVTEAEAPSPCRGCAATSVAYSRFAR